MHGGDLDEDEAWRRMSCGNHLQYLRTGSELMRCEEEKATEMERTRENDWCCCRCRRESSGRLNS